MLRETWFMCSRFIWSGLCWSSLFCPVALGVVVTNADNVSLVNPGRPTFGINFDGVVRVRFGEPVACNAALITDFHLLSAASCFDTDADGTVDFDLDTLVSIPFEQADGVEWRMTTMRDIKIMPSWSTEHVDLAVIALPELAPVNVPRYVIYSGQEELGAEVVITGHGYTGLGATGRNTYLDEKLAGKNRYEATGDAVDLPHTPSVAAQTLVYDFDNGDEANNTLQQLGVTSDLGLGGPEAMASLGDAGAPTFLNGVIAGIASRGRRASVGDVNDVEDQSFGELYFDTRVGQFREFIDTATDGLAVYGEAVDPVELLRGDLNLDGSRDVTDVQLLGDYVARRTDPFFYDEAFDLDGDRRGTVNDLLIWVEQLEETWIGDLDLDGTFDKSDLEQAFAAGEYLDGISKNSNWTSGDWNGNGDFTAKDVLFAIQRGGYQQGPRMGPAPPEPDADLVADGLSTLMDQLSAEVRAADGGGILDFNHDGAVNEADRVHWIQNVVRTRFGDANFDAQVDFADFLALSNHFGDSGGWAEGDFDGNATVDFADFLFLSDNFGAAAASLATVPEPTGLALLLSSYAMMLAALRRCPGPPNLRGAVSGS